MDYRSLVALLTPVHGAAEARAIARVVMEDCFGLTLTDVLMGKDTSFSAAQRQRLSEIAARLAKGEPVQQVVGWARFCDRRFSVSPSVLTPRPETEGIIRLCRDRLHGSLTACDLGTGSGCIAITLALESTEATVYGVDISADALAVARRNAASLGAEVTWIEADLLSVDAMAALLPDLDLLVSNPPYIEPHEAATMSPTVLDYEPHTALFAPADDPLCFYRAIGRLALRRLRRGGMVVTEVNAALAAATAAVFAREGFAASVHEDIFGRPRFVTAG